MKIRLNGDCAKNVVGGGSDPARHRTDRFQLAKPTVPRRSGVIYEGETPVVDEVQKGEIVTDTGATEEELARALAETPRKLQERDRAAQEG